MKEAYSIRKTSDSLKVAWAAQWKKSDSIRIESMFLRMRSDSLVRIASRLIANAKKIRQDSIQELQAPTAEVPQVIVDTIESDDDILTQLTTAQKLRESVDIAKRSVVGGRIGTGKTYSDSITALVLKFQPDTGVASYYAEAFHGKKTSSGELYDMNANTCAHRWLPYGTLLRVTNLRNNKSAVVRVTDRGPFKHGRIIDISKSAAREIDMIRHGTCTVEVRVEP